MFKSKRASSSRVSCRSLGIRFAFPALTLVMAALAMHVAASAGAEPDKRKKGIDYTKPFIWDHAHYPKNPLVRERSSPTSSTGRVPASSSIEGLLENGNPERAIRNIEGLIKRGGLTDAEKAHNYFLLSRLYLAKTPPDFKKAVEYRRKYNEIIENLDPDKRR